MIIAELEAGMIVLLGPDYGQRFAAEVVKVRPYGAGQRLVTFRRCDSGDEWTWRQSSEWPVTLADLESQRD